MKRPSRVYGNWPLEKDDYLYNYISGQYAYMETKRREFKKSVKFQNHKSDGAEAALFTVIPIRFARLSFVRMTPLYIYHMKILIFSIIHTFHIFYLYPQNHY
jgi:hypothetical protein